MGTSVKVIRVSVTGVLIVCLISNVAEGKRGPKHHHLHETSKQHPDELEVYQSYVPKPDEQDVCLGWYCGHGRECKRGSDGAPECVCTKQCKDKRKEICGSDGRRYPSHCELHRTACLLGSDLSVDHSNACFRKRKTGSRSKSRSRHQDVDAEYEAAERNLEYYTSLDEDEDDDEEGDDDDLDDYDDAETRENDSENIIDDEKRSMGGKNGKRKQARNQRKPGKISRDNDKATDAGRKDKESKDNMEQADQPSSHRYSPPAPERRKLDAHLLDSEVGFETVLNFDENSKSAPQDTLLPEETGAAPPAYSGGERNAIDPDRDNFLSDGGQHSANLASDSSVCSPQEYEILKDNLLLYNHERMIGGVRNFKAAMESENSAKGESSSTSRTYPSSDSIGDGPEAGKDYLLSLMFSHFDRNNNGALDYDELHRIDKEEKIGKLAAGCNMVDLLRFDDSDHNGQLNINEFYTAFNKLYSVSVISLDKALEVTRMTATVGDNVEIKCDVSGSPPMPIVWRRYGVDLSTLNQEDQLRVFSDGTLYLNKIQLLHAGNYSCHAQRNQEVVQTHVLAVQTLPDVKVTPHIVWERPGHDVSMECRVMGEPFPVVQWLKNDDPLPLEMSHKYAVTGDGVRLTLKDIYFSDTGAYMCRAENSVGKRLDISSLVVIDQQTPSTVQANESQFFVFHERGIGVYDPANCRIQHQIQATDVIPGTQEYVCGDHGMDCEWGQAIRVSSSYIYVSQPKLDRLLVVSTGEMVVVDVIPTDRYPVELHYLPHLDQVWVECWRSESDDSQKTLQVIRDASERRKHHTVHPEPIDSHFDLVETLFLPPDLKSSSQFRYGYVAHKNGRGLYKMDLIALRYTKSVDLTPYNCVPQHIQFSALYGMVIVECFEPVTNRPTGQLVLDALSDSVVYYKGDRFGKPYLSPDSRKLVTVSHSPDGTTLLFLYVRETGLEFAFDVKTSMNVSDVTFFPSQRSHTYDLFASSADKDDVLFVDLESGKVEMVSGVGKVLVHGQWKSPSRPISSQGLFSKFIATPSTDAIFVINGHSRTVNCQIGGLHGPHSILWS